MMRTSLFLLSLSLLFISIDAAFPSVDFTGLLQKYATTTDGTWCTKCAAFGQPPCAMGCAGDGGGGGPCPANACPRLFTFPIVNNQPIWNIQVATAGDPYRAFSYIPLCTQASQCTESFFFSFSFKYTPGPNAAQSNFFSQQRDYLKLLFWGDGNNILGVKNGQLLGLPNGGGGDLVGSNNIGTGNAFAIPFLKDTWTHVGVQFNVQNGRTSLAFFINGIATGSTTGSVAVSNTGLQFGAYVWNGAKFTLQYKDIAITKNLPIITTGGGTTTTAAPTTATGKPTTTATPTAKVTSAPTPTATATAKPTVPIKSTTTIPPTVTTSMPTESTPPIVDTVTSPPSVVTEPPLDDTTNPPLDDTTDPPSSTDPPSVTTREPTSPPAGAGGPNMPIYNPATVALHNKATDCWTILDGIVYDISKLVLIHPGGPVIRSYCGIDCSTIFSSSHQNDAADRALLAKSYLKGTLGSMTTSKPTNPAIISIVARSNHATTITSSLLCFFTPLTVAIVLEYLL